MKTMLIGSKKGFGAEIIDRYNADSFSKSTGYNINNQLTRKELANISLDYDNIILHVYTRENGQLSLLDNILEKWIETGKKGNIIVTGSIASYYNNYSKDQKSWEYASQKTALDTYCKMAAKRSIIGTYPFKITIIKPGMLDTEKSRLKPHFVKGITAENYCKIIDFILDLPNDIIVPEIPVESIYE